MAAYITVGAKTSHGGTVITGSPHTTHNGIPIARIGNKVMCKKCKKITTIVSGDPAFVVDGAPIARGGDTTSCGAKLIATQQSFMESGFDIMGIEPPEPLQFPKSDQNNLSSRKSLYINLNGDKNKVYDGGIDGTKFSIFGKGFIEAFNEIRSTKQGDSIISATQKDSSIYRVSIEAADFQGLGLTTVNKQMMILNKKEYWEVWRSDETVYKTIVVIKINMDFKDPYFVKSGSKNIDGNFTDVFKPSLTRVMAHELGHVQNYIDTGSTNNKHKSILYENNIMKELDKNAVLRHPSAEHGGGFAD